MRRSSAVFLLGAALVFSLGVRAEDEAKTTTDLVREAFARGEGARLSELAAVPEVDCWAVVDDLLAAGYADAAQAFAEAYAGADAAALQRFAAETPPENEEVRDVLAVAEAAIEGGDWEGALESLREAKPAEGPVLAMRAAVLEGRLLSELGRFHEAEEPYARAANRAEEVGRDLAAEADSLATRFYALADAEDWARLVAIAGRGVDVAQMLRDPNLGVDLANLGTVYLQLSLAHRGARYLDRAFYELARVQRQAPNPETSAWAGDLLPGVDLGRAQAYSMRGRHADALFHGERALTWYAERGDTAGIAGATATLSDVHAAYGGFLEALRLNDEVRKLLTAEDEATRVERLRLLVNDGHALQELGHLEEALGVLEKAVPALERLTSGRGLAVALLNLGEIHEKRGKWNAARECYERVLALDDLDPWLQAFAYVRHADALAERGSARDPAVLAAAEDSYVAAAKVLPMEADPGLHLLLRLGRGEVALARGDGKNALDHVRASVALLERLTGGLADGEALKARSQADRQRLFALATRAAIATGDAANELEMCERSRARAFLAALGGRGAVQESLLDEQARRRLQVAGERLSTAYAAQRAAFAAGKRTRIRAAQAAVGDAQVRYNRTVRSLERESRRSPRLTAVSQPSLPTVEEVQSALGPNDALVFYTLLDPTSRALVVRRDSVRGVPLASRSRLLDACQVLDVDGEESADRVLGRLRALGALLLDTLELPEGTRRVLVSPDGVLAHLPWTLLPPLDAEEPLEVVLVPSAASWLHLRARSDGKGKRALAIGDPNYEGVYDEGVLRVYAGGRALPPLPATHDEVMAITTKSDVRLLKGEATEAAFAAALPEEEQWRIVHVATHCILDEDDPSLSALALTPAPPDDGFLTALELSTLEIPADLVVLSGCATGRDRSVTGEGITGLTRAVLLAGASRVLVSQWPVDDDAARHFMVCFHDEWAKPDVDIPEALRRARLSTRARWPHPRDWGPWVLWGRAD